MSHRKTLWRASAVLVLSFGVAAASGAAEDPAKPAAGNWTTVGGNDGNTRYSALSQINTGNIGKLGGAWVRELGTKCQRFPPKLGRSCVRQPRPR